MKSISFCIATGVNEREYLKLLLRSLKENTNLDIHEIVVWVDTDNQNTYAELIELKSTEYPMMKIGKNKYNSQLGNQFNSSVMVKEAKNEIICFLHSDMVVGRNFDKEVFLALDNNPNNIVCSARIEPPLHPPSPEKILKDFGTSPEEFQYDTFQNFSQELIDNNRENESGYFAPCTFYKDTFLKILGGFDTQFRCSREDSDYIIKIEMNNLNPIISWKGVVYHFTCVSSRGKDWFKKDTDLTATVNYQKYADNIEMKRFIRKWGYFAHDYRSRYDIGFYIDIDCIPNWDILFLIEPHCSKLFLNDTEVVQYLINKLKFDTHYFSNKKLGHSVEDWQSMKKFWPVDSFDDRIQFSDLSQNQCEVNVHIKMNSLIKTFMEQDQEIRNFFNNINHVIKDNESGTYELFDGIIIDIGDNLTDVNLKNKKNENLDKLLKLEDFSFE